jgi:hypothetical protein
MTMQPLTRKLKKKAIQATKTPALELLADLANTPDTEEAMALKQNTYMKPTEPGALRRFCAELRIVWKDLDRSHANATRKMRLSPTARKILLSWYQKHPLSDERFWRVDWENHTFFPTDEDWVPYFAFVLSEYQHLAGICKSCGRYFRKHRVDASHCYHPDCQKKNTLKRVNKSHKKHGRRRAS